MAKIPTLLSETSARTPLSSPVASGFSAAQGLGDVSQGISRLASGLANIGLSLDARKQAAEDVAKKKVAQDNTKWAHEWLEKEKVALSEWLSKESAYSSEGYATDFMELAEQRMGDLVQSAPSPEAGDILKQNLTEYIGRQYDRALGVAEQNRVTNLVTSADEQLRTAFQVYHFNRQTPGMNALGDLEDSRNRIAFTISQNFKNSPKTRDALLRSLDEQIIQGTINHHLEYSKIIAETSEYLDEGRRKSLLAEIKSHEEVENRVERDVFDRFRKDNLAMSENGTGGTKIDIERYKDFYPDHIARSLKSTDDAHIDIFNKSRSILDEISGFNPIEQRKYLQTMRSGVKGVEDDAVLKLVESAVSHNLKMVDENRIQWMQETNPEVKVLYDRAAQSTEETRLVAIKDLNDAVLKYQGYPPQGASEKESKYYLGLPTDDRHLLTLGEAERFANEINAGSPDEAISRIQQVLVRFPGEGHAAIAFNDLVSLPKSGRGIRQEYQLAFQNKGAWWLDTYLSALKGSDSVGKLSDEKRGEISNRVESDPLWKSFQASMVGDNLQRAGEIQGFKDGIITYAQSMVLRGKGLKESVGFATKLLISETMGFTNVNGQPMMILRERANSDLPPRTDDEINDIGNKLKLALRYIDPREIDQSNFKVLDALGPPDRVERLHKLRDILFLNAFFQTGIDGQHVTLYYLDDVGAPFQVRDKKGNPLKIYFDEIPHLGSVIVGSSVSAGPGAPANIRIYEGQNPVPPVKIRGNNWPIRPPWIK